MIEILEKIFGSAARVKIMRLFLFNPEETFSFDQAVSRTKITSPIAHHELSMMEKIGLIKRRSFFRDIPQKKTKKKRTTRRRILGWTVNPDFTYLSSLQDLLIHISPLQNESILKKLSHVGKLKLVIISGVFMNNWDSRIDLLVVGDNLHKGALEKVVKVIESEIGREIRYSFFETPDFLYRLGIYDKLIRDVLDYQHEKILDKINLQTRR